MSDTPLTCDKLLDLAEGFEIWRVNPRLVKEQDKNARVQSHETFKALVRNVAQRGAMESLPFCTRQGDDFFIISGHHRVRAAIQAELPAIIILVDPRPMTRSEIVAKQLAHNAINGKDDAAMLLQLVAEIHDVEAMIESSVDRDALEKMVKQNVSVPDVKVDYEWRTLSFAFLPTQIADMQGLIDAVGDAETIGVVDLAIYDEFTATMRRLGKAEDIRSVGALIYRMMEITKAHLTAQGEGAAAADNRTTEMVAVGTVPDSEGPVDPR